MRVTTLETIAGRIIEDTLGAVRGSSIWSRRVSKNSTAGHRALEHMTNEDMANGLAQVRDDAETNMMKKATAMGADTIVGLRIDLIELGNDSFQAIASGTAVTTAALPMATPAFAPPLMANPFGKVANDSNAVVLPFPVGRQMAAGADRYH